MYVGYHRFKHTNKYNLDDVFDLALFTPQDKRNRITYSLFFKQTT